MTLIKQLRYLGNRDSRPAEGVEKKPKITVEPVAKSEHSIFEFGIIKMPAFKVSSKVRTELGNPVLSLEEAYGVKH